MMSTMSGYVLLVGHVKKAGIYHIDFVPSHTLMLFSMLTNFGLKAGP